MPTQRGSKSEAGTSLIDGSRAAALGHSPAVMKAGTAGTGSVMERLLSITATDAMLGRRCGSSWTQSSPTWMHLSISCGPGPSAWQISGSCSKLQQLQCPRTCRCRP
nr:unnamed protein product [Digitaria exilis]